MARVGSVKEDVKEEWQLSLDGLVVAHMGRMVCDSPPEDEQDYA